MSEHKNTILAIVLSLLVVVGWQYFIGYPQMERQRQEAQLKQQEQQAQTQPGATQSGSAPPGSAQSGTPQAGATPPIPEVPGTPATGNASAQAQAASRETVIGSSPRVAIAPALFFTAWGLPSRRLYQALLRPMPALWATSI